ncbi:SHOT1 protein, partial [Anseranas semipalmata]|nr:SHOT1 protein [Anseranas semipalmata]
RPQTLAEEVDEARARLNDFEQASQVLLAELSALEAEFEIEKTCRQQAEVYAAQVQKENTKLKRLSLALPPVVGAGDPPEEGDAGPDPAQHQGQQLKGELGSSGPAGITLPPRVNFVPAAALT